FTVDRSRISGRSDLVLGQPVRIAVRPESLTPVDTREGSVACEVETSIFVGSHRTLIVRTEDGTQLQIQVPSSPHDTTVQPGSRAFVRLNPRSISVFVGEG